MIQGGVTGLGLAELGSRQKVPTAAVGVAVGRSRPPQAFLQLAYGYLPLVWAGTLTHYLPAFLLQAGRILPVRLSMPLKQRKQQGCYVHSHGRTSCRQAASCW